MARRRSAAQKAAFRKMIAGLKASRGRRSRGGGVTVIANPRRRARKRRRSRSVVVMANPRRRRRRVHMRHNPRFHRRRRRNPGMGDTVKSMAKVAIPAVLSGASFGLLDAKLLVANNLSQPVRYAVKAAYALVLGILFRKNPVASAAAMGGVLGSLGSDVAATLGGGTPAAPTTTAAVKGIGALLREDPQAMGLLVQQMNGLGYVVDNNVSLSRLRGMGTVGVGDDTESYNDVNLG